MAAVDRLFSDDAVVNLPSNGIWQKSGIPCTRSGAGHLGLCPTGDTHLRGLQDATTNEKREDQQLLAELIRPHVIEDAENMSSELISRFGSLPRVLAAFEDGFETTRLPLIVSQHLRTLRPLVSRLLRRDVSAAPILSTTDALLAYLHNEMAHLVRETLRVFFLDVNNRLLDEKIMWEGTVSSVQIHPREIIREALLCNASALILVHNHPSGNPTPSDCDIAITHELCAAAKALGIVVHDHIILARCGHLSMRANDMLNPH